MKLRTAAWGGLLWLSGCVPQAFELSDYRSHLTAAEKQQLAAGQALEKMHVSYWRFFPKQVYWQGKLRVEPAAKGKYKFTKLGHWQQFDEHGGLLADADYQLKGRWTTGHERLYYPAGTLSADVLTQPVVLNGDSVLETRLVNFRSGVESDTSFVERWYLRDGKYLRPSVRSFDLAGRRPVPKNWKGEPYTYSKP
ncbi:hypothetical protein [Hymenobacter properus]|uniref:Lipoprotein n=1 Tax=Hymenobacter properus TaxID=2791026 RepID=A0A931FHV6_9BACT|nr:hypothetical protein [Hymenobacter properus]MBF9140098.1 hypothetical protein [Hymenobacter properus]MBR7718905.1 hypothetical protein [Microvirga sp. SRT04]